MIDLSARRWISVKEAGVLYSLHPKTIARLCSLRKIPFTRIPSSRGGHGVLRIDRVAFDQHLEEQAVTVATEPLDRRRRTR